MGGAARSLVAIPGARDLLVTASAVALAFLPSVPGASTLLGHVTAPEARAAASIGWLSFVIARIAFRVLGEGHRLVEVLSTVDQLVRYGAFLSLIFLSGSASSPLWSISMASSFVWRARPPLFAKVDLAVLVASHLALATAFVVSARPSDGWMTVLCLLASVVGHTTTARMARRNEDVRSERLAIERELAERRLLHDRERMARELHDGLGADVMALVLRLQRAARSGENAKAPLLAERARRLLDELRGVVWSLRNEQGTLAELGKLIDAAVRGVLGSVSYERTTSLDIAQARIGATAALAALEAARGFARTVTARANVTAVTLAIDVERRTTLRLSFSDDSGGERLVAAIAIDEPVVFAQ